MGGLDTALFRAVNGWPDALSPVLRPFSVALDKLPGQLLLGVLVVAMVVRGAKPRRAAILSLVAFPIADALCTMAKKTWPMHRPFQVLPDVAMRVGGSSSMGTASSHAANMAAVATVMTLTLGIRWGALWIAVALIVGVSRVYVGAHYPSQVLFGWLIGTAVGATFHFALAAIERKRTKQSPMTPAGE